MVDELVRMYDKGAITADHLVVESLHRLNPAEPALVLSLLPREVLERMLVYTQNYHPGAMKTNYGLQPASDQVAVARRWIESNLREPNGAAILKPHAADAPDRSPA